MPKNKLPRKSTHIDMTAMCDVAFLLLTFFMLATKFKPDEPVIVQTPSSISAFPKPENAILLTLDKEGKIFFGYDNKDAKKIMIDSINQNRNLGLTQDEMNEFITGASFGGSLAELKTYLNLDQFDKKNFDFKGIPISKDTSDVEKDELVFWVQSARGAGQAVGEPPRIAIKADSKTPYPKVKNVLDVLVENGIDRFNLITSAEAIPEGSAAYEEQMSNGTGG